MSASPSPFKIGDTAQSSKTEDALTTALPPAPASSLASVGSCFSFSITVWPPSPSSDWVEAPSNHEQSRRVERSNRAVAAAVAAVDTEQWFGRNDFGVTYKLRWKTDFFCFLDTFTQTNKHKESLVKGKVFGGLGWTSLKHDSRAHGCWCTWTRSNKSARG